LGLGLNKPRLLGLDVSGNSVKLLELSRSGSVHRVETYAIESLPPGDAGHDAEVVSEAVRKAVKRSGSKLKHAAIAVDSSATISKVIQMPSHLAQKEDDLQAQIELEADQYIPYPLEEVRYDFEVQGPSSKNPNTIDVLIAATRAENVDNRVAMIEAAGLEVRVVDVEPFAVENVFPYILPEDIGSGKLVGVVDMGGTRTSLSVFNSGDMIYTRDQDFGGHRLIDDIMRRYEIPRAEALKALRQPASIAPDIQEEVIEPFFEIISQQINRSLQFFFTASNTHQLDVLLFGGGVGSLPNLTLRLGDHLGMPVSLANPFRRMGQSGRAAQQNLALDAPALLIACGLALRSFDPAEA